MALTWDVSLIKNAYREISKEEYKSESDKRAFFQCPKYEDEEGKFYQMTAEANMLIMVCGLTIGIPTITESNYKRVFNRISIMESLYGSYLFNTNPKTQEKEEYPFTEEMVKEHIGLKTNGIELNRRQFEKKILEFVIRNKEI